MLEQTTQPSPQTNDSATGGPKRLFDVLTKCWKDDLKVRMSSNPNAVLDNCAYKYIIEEMGKAALPYIFDDYQRNGGRWPIALRAILGFSPVKLEHRGDVDAVRADWIEWAVANRYLTSV